MGLLEARRDPHSSITSSDVERRGANVKSNTEERRSTRRTVEAAVRVSSQTEAQPPSSSFSLFDSFGSSKAVVARAGTALAATWLMASPAFAAEELVLSPDFKIVGILIAGFVLLMFPANQLIFKPIFRALDEREERIQGARSRATQIQSDADGVLADYEGRIREARLDAEAARKDAITAARSEQTSMTTAARSEAEGEIERARETLAGELEDARQRMRGDAQDLAREAAAQILGRSLS